MKANRKPLARHLDARGEPDGAQLLLLAGFILAGAAIIAIGTYQAVKRTSGEVTIAQHDRMVDLFLNTRTRAVDYFGIVSGNDTVQSVNANLDLYLNSQYRIARALGLDLNATLAGDGTIARFTESDYVNDPKTPGVSTYITGLCPNDHDPSTGLPACYDTVAYDGTNDGLIQNAATKQVLGAIIFLEIVSPNAQMNETLVIDVPATTV